MLLCGIRIKRNNCKSEKANTPQNDKEKSQRLRNQGASRVPWYMKTCSLKNCRSATCTKSVSPINCKSSCVDGIRAWNKKWHTHAFGVASYVLSSIWLVCIGNEKYTTLAAHGQQAPRQHLELHDFQCSARASRRSPSNCRASTALRRVST